MCLSPFTIRGRHFDSLAMAAAEQRSLYRHFLRIIYAIAQPAPKRVSLIRLLRPQLRDLLQQRDVNLTEARATSELYGSHLVLHLTSTSLQWTERSTCSPPRRIYSKKSHP